MAFCMGAKSKNQASNSKKKNSFLAPQKRIPAKASPLLMTQRQIKDNQDRQSAARSIMNLRSKTSFIIKTSVQQTRFSKKDIKDLKDRFEKHSQWVLVNQNGVNIESEAFEQDTSMIEQHQTSTIQENNKSKNQALNSSQRTNSTSPNLGNKIKTNILKGNYKKVDITMEDLPQLGIHYVRKMSKNQFRSCMGLLGLESNAFLSDRIFEVVDTDKDQYINFAQFATIMDTLINGTEDEKHEFSFALLDIYDSGYFDFQEFQEFISKIIAHWCIITGSQVKVDKDGLKEIFDRMDQNKDGIVDMDEYKQSLKGNPGLFQWFDILNQGVNDGKKTKKDILDMKVKAATDILQLQQKLENVKNQVQNIEFVMQHNNNATSSKQSSMLSHFDTHSSNQKKESQITKGLRKSFNLQHFEQTIQDNKQYDDFDFLSQDVQRQSEHIRFSKNNQLQFEKFKKLLNFDNNSKSPKMDQLGDFSDIAGMFYKENKFTFNPNNDTIMDQVTEMLLSPIKTQPKKARKIDYAKESIMAIKKQQDLLKQRKKEFGEKKIYNQAAIKKQQQDSDNDMIEDPDSPDNKSQYSNNNQKGKYRLRTPSPLLKLHSAQITTNRGLENNNDIDNRSNYRKSSIRSNNSQLTKPDHQQQQSSQVNHQSRGNKVLQHFQRQSRHNSRMNNNNRTPNTTAQQTNHHNHTNTNGHGYTSDFSPSFTNDGTRSERAQVGGPLKSYRHQPYSDLSQRRGHKQTTQKHHQRLSQVNIEELVISNNSSNHNKNEQVQQQQQLILTQLNDITELTSVLLQRLQEDQDSAIGEQIKEYVEKQKSKLLKEMNGINEEGKESFDGFSINDDNGDLRPLNEIQQFFKKRSRKHFESIKRVNHTHKALNSKQAKSFIHIGHDNWNLVLHMMLGVRQSVRNVMHEEVFELIEQDFQRKYCYELVAKKTKNMRLFEFYDFSPRVFHLIRTMYGITPDAYLKSIGPENLIGNLLMGNISSLKEQCSTGKSGSFFYYTADSNFMLKTISNDEFHHLRDILKDYYDHLALYPHSLITRFYGLHKIKYQKSLGGKARIYFVIMANVFKTSREINVRFDLKGSTQGRKTKKSIEEYVDASVALKDLDFLDGKQKIKVAPDIMKALIQQMEYDVSLFQKLNINDYSLLLGIHYLNSPREYHEIMMSSPNITQIIKNSFNFNQNKNNRGTPNVQYSTNQLLRPPVPFYEAHDGGILSEDGKCVYFIGIIDTLTLFGTKKKLEYSFKSIRYGNKTISCIPPKQYGDRFLSFMKSIFEYSETISMNIPKSITNKKNSNSNILKQTHQKPSDREKTQKQQIKQQESSEEDDDEEESPDNNKSSDDSDEDEEYDEEEGSDDNSEKSK